MFALHRRKAWLGAQIEASAWDFDLDDLEYRGTVVLPVNTNSVQLCLAQFVDDGYGFVYWGTNTCCKVPLSVPYDLLSADLTVVPSGTTPTDYSSASLISLTSASSAQFSPDGRAIYFYSTSLSDSAFRMLQLDVPFFPFNKAQSDISRPVPSLNIADNVHAQFSPNGLNFYTCPVNTASRELHHYVLSEPFDVTTFSLASRSVSLWALPRDDTYAYGFGTFAFSPDGLRLITAGSQYAGGSSNSARIRMWSLRAPWDISTISHLKSVSLPAQQTPQILRLFVDPSSSFFYCHVGSGRLTQYAIPQS